MAGDIQLGVIGGTGASLPLEDPRDTTAETPFGKCVVAVGVLSGRRVGLVRRHEEGHRRLSSSVNHRASVWALNHMGAEAILGTSVVGILDPQLSLASPILFDDIFFPDNRLPEGVPCTFFTDPGDEERGHLIFERPFSPGLRGQVSAAARRAGISLVESGTYAYMLGPRFNSRAEISWLQSVGACAASQTAGPEAILAAELETPYCLVGFGVDYANGVAPEPTPVDVLDANIGRASDVLGRLIGETATSFQSPTFDTGLVYRIEGSR